MTGNTVLLKEISLKGISIAGVSTCFFIPELDICFDVAQGFSFAVSAQKFFITHAHMDHAAGIPYLISQRALNNLPPADFYMLESIVEPLKKIMDLWQALEGFEYKYNFYPLKTNEKVMLNPNWYVQSFQTLHRVPSLGFTLFKQNKKLKKEFQGKNERELKELAGRGVSLNDEVITPWLSFTGDTQIEFLDLSPQVKNSKYLIMEVTYIDQKRTKEQAREWGHIHLDEFLERVYELKNEKIILSHQSRRHQLHELETLLDKKLEKGVREKVFVFPRSTSVF